MTASTPPTSTPTLPPPTRDRVLASPQRGGAVLLFVLLLLALAGRTAFLLWEPPFDGSLHYEQIAPLGGAYWAMNLFLGGPAFGISWIATALLAAQLARGRSAPVTLAAATVTGIAGLIFALAITAEVLPFAFAADASVFPEAEGRALFDAFNAQLGALVPAILGAQAAVALGILVVLITSLVTRALPRWLAIAGLAYLLVFALVPFELLPRAATVASDLVQTLLVVGISWFGLRAALRGESVRDGATQAAVSALGGSRRIAAG